MLDDAISHLKKGELTLNEDNWAYCSFSAEDAYINVKSAFRSKRFDAIFAFDNAMTQGSLRLVNELELKIDKDIYLMGFDDIKLYNSLITENIGTISQPVYSMGKAATELLIDLIENIDRENIIIRFNGNIKV